METYNRYTQQHNSQSQCVCCLRVYRQSSRKLGRRDCTFRFQDYSIKTYRHYGKRGLQNYRSTFIGCEMHHNRRNDKMIGYNTLTEVATARRNLHKMSVVESGGLPYSLKLAVGYPYMITMNLGVEYGIVKGAIGTLKYIEYLTEDEQVTIYGTTEVNVEPQPSTSTRIWKRVRLWLEFPNPSLAKYVDLEQLLLYADEHYLAGKLPLGNHLGKVLHGVKEYHQRNVVPLRFHASELKWTGYHRLWLPRPLQELCGQSDVEQCGGILPLTRAPPHPYTVIICPQNKWDSSVNTTFCQSVTFNINLAWHHCRRSCRCSGVKGSARKGCLDLRFASAMCLEIVCGTIATPTSARIVERVTVGSTSARRTILRSSYLVVFLVTPDPVFRAWVPSLVHCCQQFLTAHLKRSTCSATRHVDQPAVFLPMIRPLSNSFNSRRKFVEWAQNEIAVVPYFHKRILFSDEAHFCLNGYVNKQNCRIWSEANPQVYVETPLHPEKLTIMCALRAGGIIGPYFFKNAEGHNVTVNGDRYRAMITNFFISELNNHDVQELWFQQDGATCHTARATNDLLKDTFGDRLISRFGPVNWPPRSCDLTPLDYFL
ncbi:transposable element Tc3 transposase [Trichonephila clavipes]|nr:transposable element Tc3 transposase [Trichonephila clavipes]